MIYVSRPVSCLFCRLSVYTDRGISITVQGTPCAPQEHSSKTNILPARGWRYYRAAGAIVVQRRSLKIKNLWGSCRRNKIKKDGIYIVKPNERNAPGMSIHIIFANGSNPYIKYNMAPADFAAEILKWSKSFDLEYAGTTGGDILHFTATDKLSTKRPDDLPPW